jgi:hypothetical protein
MVWTVEQVCSSTPERTDMVAQDERGYVAEAKNQKVLSNIKTVVCARSSTGQSNAFLTRAKLS